jgi:hypothetical protein
LWIWIIRGVHADTDEFICKIHSHKMRISILDIRVRIRIRSVIICYLHTR